MKLIVGLGNPGDRYINTRHNVGFFILDELARQFGVEWNKSKFNGEIYINEDFILAKPHTFMNLSGNFVKTIANYYKININDIIIVFDDVDTELGRVKVKRTGSSGGQKGMQNIIESLGTDEIKRIKIGIGRPLNKDIPLSDYVLKQFSKKEKKIIDSETKHILEALTTFIFNDIKFMYDLFSNINNKNEK